MFSVSLKRLACGQKIKPGKLVGFATRENQKLVWTIDYRPKTQKIGSLHKSGFITKWSTFDHSCSDDATVPDLIIDFSLDKIPYGNIFLIMYGIKRYVAGETSSSAYSNEGAISSRPRMNNWTRDKDKNRRHEIIFPTISFSLFRRMIESCALYIPPQLHLLPENWNKEGEREREREKEINTCHVYANRAASPHIS